jgi:hypothetical protein
VHVDDEAHDTLFRKANWAPAGVGVGWMLQLVPFHPSARVPAFETPTAVQPEDVGQATLVRKPPPCAGLGVGWMLQLVPFHRSARVLALGVKALEPPTAVQADADVHETPLSVAPPWDGLGVGWMLQRVPFHRSARVVPSALPPTAVHAEGEVHDTLLRAPPARLGVGWRRQAPPFHCSATARTVPVLVVLDPTAMHADGAVQATPSRPLSAIPDGFGVGRMRHEVPFHCSARLTPSPEVLT